MDDVTLWVLVMDWRNQARRLDQVRGFDTDPLTMARAATLRRCAADLEAALSAAGSAALAD